MIEEAVSLFRHQYGIHPAQSAYPVIDVYEKQHAYLYASSKEAVKAFFMACGCRYDASFLRRSQISKTKSSPDYLLYRFLCLLGASASRPRT